MKKTTMSKWLEQSRTSRHPSLVAVELCLLLALLVHFPVENAFAQAPPNPSGGGVPNTGTTTASPPNPSLPLRDNILELRDRVDDSARYLSILVAFNGVLLAVIAVGLVWGMWSFKTVAESMVDKHFAARLQDFNSEIQPIIDASGRDLQNRIAAFADEMQKTMDARARHTEVLHALNIDNLREAYRLMWISISLAMREFDENRLKLLDMTEVQRQEELRNLAKRRHIQYATSHYLVSLMSYRPDEVIDAAQQLGALGERLALGNLKQALGQWDEDNEVRAAIQNAIMTLVSSQLSSVG